METLAEKIKVMQHFENGGEVEYSSSCKESWKVSDDPVWNWYAMKYRIKESKKTITIEKWLMVGCDGHHYIGEASIDYIEAHFIVSDKVKLLETYEVEL